MKNLVNISKNPVSNLCFKSICKEIIFLIRKNKLHISLLQLHTTKKELNKKYEVSSLNDPY